MKKGIMEYWVIESNSVFGDHGCYFIAVAVTAVVARSEGSCVFSASLFKGHNPMRYVQLAVATATRLVNYDHDGNS